MRERAFLSFLHGCVVRLQFNMRRGSDALMTGSVLKVKSTLAHVGGKLPRSIGAEALSMFDPISDISTDLYRR